MGFRIRLKSGRDVVIGWLKEDYTIPSQSQTIYQNYLNNFAFDTGTSLFKFRKYVDVKGLSGYVDVTHPYIADTEMTEDGFYIEQFADNLWGYNIQNIDETHLGQSSYLGYEQVFLSTQYSTTQIPSYILSWNLDNYVKPVLNNDFNGWASTDIDKAMLVFVPFGQKPGAITDFMIMTSWEFVSSSSGRKLNPLYRGQYYRVNISGTDYTEFLNFLNGSSLVEEKDSSPTGDDYGNYDTSSDDISAPSLDDINTTSAISTSLLRAYELTNVNVQSLASKLWDDSFYNTIKKVQNSPIDNIIKLHCLPFNVMSGEERAVRVGNVDMGFNAKSITAQFQEVDFGSLELSEFYGNALDYTATTVSLFLPFIGTQELDISDVGSAILHLRYRIDVLTGNCTAMINVARNRDDTNLNSVLYQFTGNCSNEFPLNQRTNATLTKLYDSASNIASNPTNIGAYVGLAKTGLDAMIGGKAESVQRSGNLTGSSGYMGILDAYLIIDRPINIKPKDYKNLFGFPSFYTVPLSECEGYTRINTLISLPPSNVPSADWERVLELLKEGIYIGDYYRNPVEPLPPSPTPSEIVIDREMSIDSTNPVQNRVITKAIIDAKNEAVSSANIHSDEQSAITLEESKTYVDERLDALVDRYYISNLHQSFTVADTEYDLVRIGTMAFLRISLNTTTYSSSSGRTDLFKVPDDLRPSYNVRILINCEGGYIGNPIYLRTTGEVTLPINSVLRGQIAFIGFWTIDTQ